jgi:hypothetical protein
MQQEPPSIGGVIKSALSPTPRRIRLRERVLPVRTATTATLTSATRTYRTSVQTGRWAGRDIRLPLGWWALMGANSSPPAESPPEEVKDQREDLEERVEELEDLLGTVGDSPPEEVGLEHVTLAGEPVGTLLINALEDIKELKEIVGENDESAQLGGNRNQMLPLHRMWGDLIAGADHSLSVTQKRAARLFGQFAWREIEDESTAVDPSGQTYTLSSGDATEVLLGKHDDDAENLLSDVLKASQSQVVARAMRAVARLSKFEECDCESLDGCQHGVVYFRSGRPNALAAPKQSFREALQEVYGDGAEQAPTKSEIEEGPT